MTRASILRTSERKDAMRCEWRWWMAWREGLRPKGQAAPPLWFGAGIHLGLGLWYCGPGTKRGPHPAETWIKYCADELVYIKTQDLTEEQEAKYVDAQELGIAMLNGYVEKYGRDEHKLYIQPEQPFQLDIPWGDRQGVYRFVKNELLTTYAGTVDGVWRDAATGEVWLDEHKTAKAIVTTHLQMDNQAGSYWAIAGRALQRAGKLKKGEDITGIEYNFLRKGLPDDRPRDAQGYYCNKPVKDDYINAINAAAGDEFFEINPRLKLEALEAEAIRLGLTVLGERSKNQPPPLFLRERVHRTTAERKTQLQRIQDEAVHIWALKQELLPLRKNSTRDCRWDCSFYDMCELHERGGNWEEFRDMTYKVEDPYKDHRKSTDG